MRSSMGTAFGKSREVGVAWVFSVKEYDKSMTNNATFHL